MTRRHRRRHRRRAITLAHRDVLEVPWASSLREYRTSARTICLYWRIIRHAIESGRASLDFGRSTPNEGTFHFTSSGSPGRKPLYWEYVTRGHGELPRFEPANPKYRAAIAVWDAAAARGRQLHRSNIVKSIP